MVTRSKRTLAILSTATLMVVEAPPEATECRGTLAGLREHDKAGGEAVRRRRHGDHAVGPVGGW